MEEQELLSEARLHVERTRPSPSVSSSRPDSARPIADPRSRESSQFSGRRMTEALLREDGPPLNISATLPTVLVIEGEQGGEVSLYLQSFRPTSSLGHERCGICLGVEQDDPLVLKCSRCTSHVHLGCMSSWLGTLRPGSKSSCVLCKNDEPFDAYYDMPTVEALWNQRQRQASVADNFSLSTTRRDNEQPPIPITPSVEASPTSTAATLTTAGPSTHRLRQGPDHVDYPRLPTTSAFSNPPSPRRSVRRRRAPDRYEP
ncbi:hypothetical protein N7490_002052 [Penicillium lividum]|nr:hypothetical protein N7490_002052 [Penicillium lividum]